MKTPFLLVNVKTYRKGSGDDLLDLAYSCEKIADMMDRNIAMAVQNADINRVASRVDIPILAQHADSDGYGSNTGSDIIPTLQHNGASGVIINHSEDQVPLDEIKDVVKKARKHSMASIVCVDEPSLAERVKDEKPSFIAYEPPELIGGSTSVASAKPELIEEVRERGETRKTKILVGAGVKGSTDVEKALELGSKGVLVASGAVKADDPEQAVRELVEPM
ncbi:MAG: triose-phosphate isomerase [Candidatus Nanohaloarchaea archaeon]|nr:triose-phosphate isomerase [Candidatus Nanohaloarchaea archaeon]